MAFNVRFKFVDDHGRNTFRTYHNTQATIALVLTQVGVLAPVIDAAIEGGLTDVLISQVSTADAFAQAVDANIDTNGSLKVLAGDGFNYDFNVPMILPSLVLAGGVLDTDNVLLTNLVAEFASGKTWRINLRNPTDITEITGGSLDK